MLANTAVKYNWVDSGVGCVVLRKRARARALTRPKCHFEFIKFDDWQMRQTMEATRTTYNAKQNKTKQIA